MRDRNPPKKPKGAPEQARPRTRTTARHRHVPPRRNRPAPCCAPRPKPPRDRTGRTRDVEFIEGIDKCRGGDPDGLFASSLATSTTARARPESRVSVGPRKHGALTGLAQRASQPSGGSLTSNREAGPPSPRPRWTVNHLWLMTKPGSE